MDEFVKGDVFQDGVDRKVDMDGALELRTRIASIGCQRRRVSNQSDHHHFSGNYGLCSIINRVGRNSRQRSKMYPWPSRNWDTKNSN